MNSIYEALENSIAIKTTAWVLIHFLWQSCIVAAIVGMAALCCRRTHSRKRYQLYVAGLVLVVLCPIATVAYLMFSDDSPASIGGVGANAAYVTNEPVPFNLAIDSDFNDLDLNPGALTSLSNEPAIAPLVVSTRFVHAIDELLAGRLPLVVVIWIVGVFIHVLRLIAGMIRVHRWRTRATPVQDSKLQQRFNFLCEKMQIANVRLLYTQDLAVSAVVGFWSPIVLMPASMMLGLTIKQIESVLAHELAHIKRHDYLVNIVQKFVESVFFFHPAVWWISNRISEEREHCCDDIAAKVCGDPIALAKALTAIETLRCVDHEVAMSANGGTLVKRVKRLLSPDCEPNRSIWPASFLTLVFVSALLVLLPTAIFPKTDATAYADSARSVNVETYSDVEAKFGSDDEEKPVATKAESIKVDSKTGLKQHVFANVRLTKDSAKKKVETGVDLKYSNVVRYTFIPARIAKSLGANQIGTIDFEQHRHVRSEDVTLTFIPNDFVNPRGYLRGGLHHRFVKFASLEHKDQPVVPYLDDPLWATDHLAFYGLNKTKQTKFDVIRIDRVDLGIGKEFGPVNALVLNDTNSDFGLLGSDWAAKVRGEKGETLWHSAVGEFFLAPSGNPKPKNEQSQNEHQENQKSDSANESAASAKIEFLPIEMSKHFVVHAIEIGRSPTELLKHFSITIDRMGGPENVQSITNMESIVSATPVKRFADTFEALEVIFNLPEGSKARASFVGEKVELTETDTGVEVVITEGELRWIDSVGVVRAIAKPDGGAEQLVVSTSIENDEVVMKMKTARVQAIPDYPQPPVQVKMYVESGAADDEDQPPHGSIRYEIMDPSAKEDKPLRMKMKWRYDILRLAKEAELESGKSWKKIIWGDGYEEANEESSETNGALRVDEKKDEKPNDVNDGRLPWHVTGTVTNERGDPLSHVAVRAHCGMGTLFQTGGGQTDESGVFDFRFGPGIFSANKQLIQAATISVHLEGYVEKNLHRQGDLVAALEKPDRIGWAGKTEAQLCLPGKSVNLDFVMVKAVTVKGSIVDQNGKIAAGLKVSLRGMICRHRRVVRPLPRPMMKVAMSCGTSHRDTSIKS